MKRVYKCEFCDEVSEDKAQIIEHEKECGYNPKNTIDDEVIIKLSRIKYSVDEAITYILLTDYNDKLNYFYEECDRATSSNCVASIYQKKDDIKGLISRAKRIYREELKWFLKITQRDKPEFIDAIRTYIKEPEFRI